jgi:hypothetical protein
MRRLTIVVAVGVLSLAAPRLAEAAECAGGCSPPG